MAKHLSFLTLFLLLSTLGCSSQKELIVQSKTQNVIISILDKSGSNYIELGKTPFKANSDKVKLLLQEDFLAVRLTKPGFVTENYLIHTKGRNQIKINSSLKNVSNWTAPSDEHSSLVANSIVSETQIINFLIRKGSYVDALTKVDTLLNRFPKASILHDLRGSIMLLKGDKSRSIASYEKSLSLNPANLQTKKVLNQLKKDQ